jgi:enoyl-CoA hydratase/carnithine racemase
MLKPHFSSANGPAKGTYILAEIYLKFKHKIQLQAAEILILSKKIDAKEAYERNVVNEVIPASKFDTEAWKRVEELSKLPKDVIKVFQK